MTKNILAFDLGAESGRAVVGKLGDERLELDVVHRFANIPVRTLDGLHWDVLRLFQDMKDGLHAATREREIASLGVDTWGVDFALLDRTGSLLANPHHYRDSRTDAIMEQVFEIVSREEVFEQTGIQFMPLNTLYQLFALKKQNPALLDAAQKIIMIPDLFNYWFTGSAVCEFTEATTSQFYNPVQGRWASKLLDQLQLPGSRLGEIVQPGSHIGNLHETVADEVSSGRIPVIAPACHDTGSAVAAVPAQQPDFVYISSGTWSLVGIETSDPVINEKSLSYNFTNEGGVCGTIRLLKNVMGLWILQECRRQWEREGVAYDYTRLTKMAADEEPYRSLLDPDHAAFFTPGDMPTRIRTFCAETSQPVPESPGQIARAALDSLALKYRWVIERLQDLSGRSLNTVHVVGGGTQNRLLQQLTSDATGREVICGPIEATAIGNILMQAVGSGVIGSLSDAREIIRRSFDLQTYTPSFEAHSRIDEAYGRFNAVLEQSNSIL
ncbi:MAG: rhamnulokinase [Armatimonadetes bacterium]|nr:rhamnulokinase [Armatimonadota bacterium]